MHCHEISYLVAAVIFLPITPACEPPREVKGAGAGAWAKAAVRSHSAESQSSLWGIECKAAARAEEAVTAFGKQVRETGAQTRSGCTSS